MTYKLVPVTNPKNVYQAVVTVGHSGKIKEQKIIPLKNIDEAELLDKVFFCITKYISHKDWQDDNKYLEDHITTVAEKLQVPEDDIAGYVDEVCRRSSVYRENTTTLDGWQVEYYDEHGNKFNVRFDQNYNITPDKKPFRGFF